MTTTPTDQQRVTILKHLAGGKPLDVVATIMHLDRTDVLDVASKHGYPDLNKMAWAADLLEKQLDDSRAPAEAPEREARARTATRVDQPPVAPATPPTPQQLTKPDEIRVLLNTGKQHPSKRIQAATDKAFDAIDRVRTLIREDQEKNAAKRKEAEERAAARAEVERLKRELAEAQAKLRGRPSDTTTTPASTGTADSGPTPKEIREWAHEHDVECPDRGRIPAGVRDAYEQAHPIAS